MPTLTVDIKGYVAYGKRSEWSRMLTAYSSDTVRRGRKVTVIPKSSPVYFDVDDDTIAFGLGAIFTLTRSNPLLKVKVNSYTPRIPLKQLDVIDLPGLTWWDSQRKVLSAISRSRGGVIDVSTGGGKTELEIATAVSCAKQGLVVLIIVEGTSYSNMTSRLKKYEIEHTEYRDIRNSGSESSNLIIVASPRVVYNDINNNKNIDLFNKVNVVLFDESHHVSATTWYTSLMSMKSVIRVFGFSGSSLQSHTKPTLTFNGVPIDEALVYTYVGPKIVSVSITDLKDMLDVPVCVNLTYEWPSTYPLSKLNSTSWTQVRKLFIENKERIRLITKTARLLASYGYTVLIPTSVHKYGKTILEALNQDSAVCWFGSGYCLHYNKGKFHKVSESFVEQRVLNGEYNIVISSPHMDESKNLPVLSALILTEGRKAGSLRQKVGRIVRKSNLKRSFVVNLCDTNQRTLKYQSISRKRELQQYIDVSEDHHWHFDSIQGLNNYLKRTHEE